MKPKQSETQKNGLEIMQWAIKTLCSKILPPFLTWKFFYCNSIQIWIDCKWVCYLKITYYPVLRIRHMASHGPIFLNYLSFIRNLVTNEIENIQIPILFKLHLVEVDKSHFEMLRTCSIHSSFSKTLHLPKLC